MRALFLPIAVAALFGSPLFAGGPEGAPAVPTVEHAGQAFALANSTTQANVVTDEYVLSGETLASWTRLVTVQRLTAAAATNPGAFLAYFERQAAADGATLDVVKRGTNAAVFAVRFPRSDQNDEQLIIGLVFADRANASVLNIVQYALKPQFGTREAAAQQLQSWRDKFVRQAELLDKPTA